MRSSSIALLLATVLCCAAVAGRSAAQGVPTEGFSANRFAPAPGAGNYLMVDGAVVGGHQTPSAGLLIDYAHRPFVVESSVCQSPDPDECNATEVSTDIVAYQLRFNALGALTLWQRLQIGLHVPVIATRGDSFAATTPLHSEPYVDVRGGKAFSIGDPRLSAKVRLVGGEERGFSLAAVAYGAAPLGELTAEGRNLGDETVSGGAHLAGEMGLPGMRFALNLGGALRPKRQLLSVTTGHELVYGAGGRIEATPLLGFVAELTGSTRFTSALGDSPIEARAAAELKVGDVVLVGGGGAGLVRGVGVPSFRVLAAALYRPEGLDTDGDGVPDKNDTCPTVPEDKDGFQDQDGCPDDDNDRDGIPDSRDQCPNEAEDKDGNKDDDGCPDADDDGDGIPDGYDSCPNEPEDMDGDTDDDGCPDHDRDRDGVPDDVDKCPDDPEDTDGLQDEDGCPETDADGDGIPDHEDLCPEQPEDVDGVEDEDGCPEE